MNIPPGWKEDPHNPGFYSREPKVEGIDEKRWAEYLAELKKIEKEAAQRRPCIQPKN